MQPDKNFYKVDRESFLMVKPLHDRLSCNYLSYDYEPVDEFYLAANSYILKSFYSLFPFVTNETSPSVTIDLCTSDSSCSLTDNIIQLGTLKFVDERFTQQHRVDAMYAVMLHEMWHKRYTVSGIRTLIGTQDNPYRYGDPANTSRLKPLLPTSLHVDVLNVFEDHRIERLGLSEFPGYVFYFDQLREYVFDFQLGKKYNAGHPAALVVEYLMFRVLIPEMLPWFNDQMSILHPPAGLQSLLARIDSYLSANANLAYSDDLTDLITATDEIVKMIPAEFKIPEIAAKYTSTSADTHFKAPQPVEIGPDFIDTTDIIMDKLTKLVSSIAQEKDSVTSKDTKMRTEKNSLIDASGTQYENINIYSPISHDIDQTLVRESETISRHISTDLGFLSSRLSGIVVNYELTEGELDEDELHAISHSREIFMETEQAPSFELDFAIVLDESGSMNGIPVGSLVSKLRSALTATLGILRPCMQRSYINMFVYGHSQSRSVSSYMDGVELYEYINTKRGLKDWRNLFSAKASGGNADGYAIAKVGEIMLRDSKCKQKIMVVISDGLPSAANYGGKKAQQHVKQVVDLLESRGIEIIQVCMENIEASQYMFNNYVPFDPNGDFGKQLRQIMQKKLHTFMESM